MDVTGTQPDQLHCGINGRLDTFGVAMHHQLRFTICWPDGEISGAGRLRKLARLVQTAWRAPFGLDHRGASLATELPTGGFACIPGSRSENRAA